MQQYPLPEAPEATAQPVAQKSSGHIATHPIDAYVPEPSGLPLILAMLFTVMRRKRRG
jgi:hypothetical protein